MKILNSAKDYIDLGNQLQQEEKFAEAENSFLKAIELQPENFWHYNSLAELFLKQNKWDDAIAQYQQLLKINPKFDVAHHKLGDIWRQKGEQKLAIESYLEAIKINPQSFWPFFNLGEIATNEGDLDAAIKYYQSGITIKPEHHLSHCKLGAIYRQLTEYQKAIDCYQKAIKINPYNDTPYFALQYIPVESNDLDELLSFYQEIVEKFPNISRIWGNIGDLLTQKGSREEALKCYSRGCYYGAVSRYPNLSKLQWPETKQEPPDFIIVGAAKCGTSSLFMYLGEHPQIITPHKKELDFFNKNYDKGVDWYLSNFPSITDRPELITGEASPAYFGDPTAMKRIKKHFPQTKLIVLLRNPVDRAISWHFQNVKCGYEKRSLEEVIQIEIDKIKDHKVGHRVHGWGHIIDGIYLEKLKQWFTFFPQEQFLIIKTEELLTNTENIMQEIFEFLGVSPYYSNNYQKYNTGNYSEDNKQIKEKLSNIFAPYNKELELFFDRKFNWH